MESRSRKIKYSRKIVVDYLEGQGQAVVGRKAKHVCRQAESFLKIPREGMSPEDYLIHCSRVIVALNKLEPGVSLPEKEKSKPSIDREISRLRRQLWKDLKKNQFYSSSEWKKLREVVFEFFGRYCIRCGSIEDLHVDHVVPRSWDSERALDLSNLQVLCRDCNLSKGVSKVDYRW